MVFVDDNVNIHDRSVVDVVYPPTEARRLVQHFEVHHTPKHGSWLDMAEIEINLIERNCWQRRVPDRATLAQRVGAIEHERNAAVATIAWGFRTEQARVKMQRVYPLLVSQDEISQVEPFSSLVHSQAR